MTKETGLSECQYTTTRLGRSIFQKTVIYIVTSVRTSNVSH